MHPRTTELLQHLNEHRATLRAALESIPAAQRDVKPAPDRWSAAEVIEHLGIVEAQVSALLKRGLRNAQADGPLPPDPDHSPIIPTVDAGVLLDRERRFQAPAAARPSKALTAAAAWQQLEASREALIHTIIAADGLATASIRAPHPFLGELTFQQWIVFLGLHEGRHAEQLREARARG